MPTTVSAADFNARGLTDWRYFLGRAEATFRAQSFEAAAHLVQRIAATGIADIDLRHPDRVHVVLPSRTTTDELTDGQIELAAAISTLATDLGAKSEPLTGQAVEVAIDALDIDAVRPFWKVILGYVDDAPPGYTGQIVAIKDPAGIGPPFWFQEMDEPRSQRNRFHIDVTVPHDTAADRVQAALDAGGTLLTDRYARAWWVLADPEGNEACICTWQDRPY